jgi:UV DNA damage endonuclease
MCRSFPRVLQGLSIRVHSLEASQKVRHTSLIPEPVPVARTRSLAPIHNAHHAAHHVLRFSYSSFKRVAHPLNTSRSTQSRAYSQKIDRHRPEDMVRATETPGPEAKPVDILNGDIPLPAGQAEAALDPESDEDIPVDSEELKEALGRPPPVNSSYLPLPWKGRLGYVGYTVLDTIYPADDPSILT